MKLSSSRSVVRPVSSRLTHSPIPYRPCRSPLCSLRVRSEQVLQRRRFFSLPDISKLASLAMQKEGSTIEGDSDAQRFHARKILPYSQAQLYEIVSDIPSYASFIPFCQSSSVLSPKSSPSSSSPSSPSSSSPSSSFSSSSSSSTLSGPKNNQDTQWRPSLDKPFEVDAELVVGFGGLEERYVSRVVGNPPEVVTATAADQGKLFKSLKTTWSFSPASSLSPHPSSSLSPTGSDKSSTHSPNPGPTDGPTLLTIDLAFSFANPLHRIASQAVLPMVADKMVDAFEKRCKEVWGKGTS
ncbi:dehydrase and lipid transport-domain-containing protein [Naematelia encephala]|uniref:Dehydrase and lipid transport-domain-containing protein n=1 Tax=Naematelia encephala TaxID=71784 RepID=A0A1Y2BJ93_9TREE|nr:dehydrase and lipid transport-domain-containing protein [Naematelia encephala]